MADHVKVEFDDGSSLLVEEPSPMAYMRFERALQARYESQGSLQENLQRRKNKLRAKLEEDDDLSADEAIEVADELEKVTLRMAEVADDFADYGRGWAMKMAVDEEIADQLLDVETEKGYLRSMQFPLALQEALMVDEETARNLETGRGSTSPTSEDSPQAAESAKSGSSDPTEAEDDDGSREKSQPVTTAPRSKS